MKLTKLPLALMFASACTGTATYTATATTGPAPVGGEVYTPDLVDAEPGVQVIADYDEPVFYSEHSYWRQQNGHWERSNYHDHGWVTAEAPAAVVRIHEPQRYRHYKPAGYQPRQRPVVRDHRNPPPAVRDHRDGDHHDGDRDHRDGDHDHDGHH